MSKDIYPLYVLNFKKFIHILPIFVKNITRGKVVPPDQLILNISPPHSMLKIANKCCNFDNFLKHFKHGDMNNS
jgi:hypothetical protein